MSSNTLMETLKIEFTEIGDNYVVCKMPVTPEVHQPAGILHGGATAALVETAGSFASRYFIKDREMAIRGVEISTNHVKSISEGFVYAKATNIHMGRTMQIWEVRVSDEQNNLISLGKLTTFIVTVVLIVPLAVFLFSIPHGLILASKAFGDEELMAKIASNDIVAIMSVLEPNQNLFLMLLPFVGMILAVFFATKFIHKNSLRDLTTSREKIDWSRVFFAFALWGSISAFMIGIDYLFISPENYEWNFKYEQFLILFLIVITLLPIQTSAEEYLFRGYLMQGIGIASGNRWLPLILTSIAFGLMHYANPEIAKFGNVVFVFYIGSGLFAGIMTLMDEGIELALGWHAANNMVAALLVTADWTALQTHSVLKDISNPETMPLGEVLVPVLVFFPAILLVFANKYGWTDWKGKLLGKI